MGPANGVVSVWSEQLWIWQVTYRKPVGDKSQHWVPGVSRAQSPGLGRSQVAEATGCWADPGAIHVPTQHCTGLVGGLEF